VFHSTRRRHMPFDVIPPPDAAGSRIAGIK
jgi:hypothetical protein